MATLAAKFTEDQHSRHLQQHCKQNDTATLLKMEQQEQQQLENSHRNLQPQDRVKAKDDSATESLLLEEDSSCQDQRACALIRNSGSTYTTITSKHSHTTSSCSERSSSPKYDMEDHPIPRDIPLRKRGSEPRTTRNVSAESIASSTSVASVTSLGDPADSVGNMCQQSDKDAIDITLDGIAQEQHGHYDEAHPDTVMDGESCGSASSFQDREGSTHDGSKCSTLAIDTNSMVPKPLFIPENYMYGREEESQILEEALLDFTSSIRSTPSSSADSPSIHQFVLVSGSSGTGKTKLVDSLQPFITDPDGSVNGYYCLCKFNQMKVGYSACPMMQALGSFVAQVLAEGEESIQRMKDRIISAFGNEAVAFLNELLPPLVDVLGEPELYTSNATTQTNSNPAQVIVGDTMAESNNMSNNAMASAPTFPMFFRAVCSPEKPLILVLDDMQWASEAFLGQMESLVMDNKNGGLLLMGTCRDNVPTDSPISDFMRRLESNQVRICSVGLSSLEEDVVRDIVEDVFRLPPEPSRAFAKFMFEHSEGSPFYILEIMRWLNEEHTAIQYNASEGIWTIANAASQCTSCSASGMIERRLGTFSRDLQKVLMVTACLGTRAYAHLIELGLQEDIEDSTHMLVQKGIMVADDEQGWRRYHFRHDRVQAASYDLIPAELRPAYHLEIGLRLWRALDPNQLDTNLLVVLGQMKQGVHLITDEKQRRDIAALCIRAAEKQTQTSSIRAASEHLNMAFELLGDDPWKDATYDLSLVLHKYSAEVEFSMNDSQRVDDLLDEILDNAKSFDDKVGAYSTKIHVLITRSKINLAIETAVDVLSKLGVNFPKIHSGIKEMCPKFRWSFAKIQRRLRSKSDQSIMRIPLMTDPNKIAAMQILNLLFLTTWMYRPAMFGFVVIKMVKLTLGDGLSAMSSVAFAGYGALNCYVWKVKEGVRFGKLSLALLEQFDARAYIPRCYGFVYGVIMAYTRPWSDLSESILTGQRVGLQSGDFQFANFNGHTHALCLLDGGQLDSQAVLNKMEELVNLNDLHGNFDELGLNCMIEMMNMLKDPGSDLLDHSGLLDDTLQEAKQGNKIYCLRVVTTCKAFLAFCGGDHKRALDETDDLVPWTARHDGTMHDSFGYTVEAISSFWLARRSRGMERKDYIRRGKSRMNVLKRLAKFNPYHCLVRAVLLEAEYLATRKRWKLAHDKYMHALALSQRCDSVYEYTMTNQALGWHYAFDLKNRTVGKDYLRAAARRYTSYGCLAIAAKLHEDMKRLEDESSSCLRY